LGGRTFITSGFLSGQGQSGQTAQRILPGYALGTFYGLEYVGINTAGQQEFNDYDADGNLVGTTTSPGADDFQVLGEANPDFTVGLRSQLTWGAFDASFIARWEQGRDVLNNTALVHASKSNVKQGKNILRSGLDETDESINEPAIYSSRWIEDGSFLRLQNITLGYTFELPGLLTGGRGNTARVYAAADNLLMLTGYTGYDPEAHSDAGLGTRGIDYLSYPRARSFTAGMRLSF
jgi:iron complex outermembrane receptor protein